MCPFAIMAESRTLTDKFMLRLPEGMRDTIKACADANNRSMNAEIVSALQFYLEWLDHHAQAGPHSLHDEELPEGAFQTVNTPADVEMVVAQLSQQYAKDLRKAMLGMFPKSSKED